MQNPNNPTNTTITLINNKDIRIKGCLIAITILDLMASVAFKFPRIIRGMVRKVNNHISIENIKPTNGRFAISNKVDVPELINVIMKVAINSSLKFAFC